VIDRRALEYSPYAIERTTAAARKQLLKFVEDDDKTTGPRSLSTSSWKASSCDRLIGSSMRQTIARS